MTTEVDGKTSAQSEKITVKVIYAEPELVWEQTLFLEAGSSAMQAIQCSQFAKKFPNYPFEALAIGVYGQVCSEDRILTDGDRLEIYRPLTFDPMESRRRRAIHRKAFMTKPKNRPKRRKAKLAAEQAVSGQDKT
ncbi:MAG TPA: RnfH family protein [Eoetvoesiella sp.]